MPTELVQAGGETKIDVLNHLEQANPQAKGIIAEEQAEFGATTEQIFNLRILCEKYLQHQQNLYHVFVDFKKKKKKPLTEYGMQSYEPPCKSM